MINLVLLGLSSPKMSMLSLKDSDMSYDSVIIVPWSWYWHENGWM